MTSGKPTLSVIIPAYNEEERLPTYLAEIKSYLEKVLPNSHEILVVDDGSTDATSSIAKKIIAPSNVITFEKNQGKGAAVRTGMLKAKGRFRLFTDADGATPIKEEKRLRDSLSEPALSLAIGSRAHPGGKRVFIDSKTATESDSNKNEVTWYVYPKRHFTGRIFALFTRIILGLPYYDTQCGFKMLKDSAVDQIFPHCQMDRFVFDVEVLYLAKKLGFHTKEIPVNWHDVLGSKVNMLRDSWQMFWQLYRVRLLH